MAAATKGPRACGWTAGAGVGVVHDFALPAAPELVRVIPDQLSLTRSFWLIRHADDGRVERLNRFADLLEDALGYDIPSPVPLRATLPGNARAEPVGDDEGGAALRQLLECRLDFPLGGAVERHHFAVL